MGVTDRGLTRRPRAVATHQAGAVRQAAATHRAGATYQAGGGPYRRCLPGPDAGAAAAGA